MHVKAVAEGSDLDEAAEAVKRWLSSAGNDWWLAIYDNYDTPKLLGHDDRARSTSGCFFLKQTMEPY